MKRAISTTAVSYTHLVCFKAAPEQRTQKIVGGTHCTGKFIGHLVAVNGGGVNLKGIAFEPAGLCPQMLQNFEQDCHIADIGDVLDHTAAFCQNRGGNNRNSGILSAADGDFSM